MTLDHRKIEIIQEIVTSTQEELLNAIDEVIKKFSEPKFQLNLKAHENLETFVNLEKIKSERPLVSFDMNEFEDEVNDLEWDKSIDELLLELK